MCKQIHVVHLISGGLKEGCNSASHLGWVVNDWEAAADEG